MRSPGLLQPVSKVAASDAACLKKALRVVFIQPDLLLDKPLAVQLVCSDLLDHMNPSGVRGLPCVCWNDPLLVRNGTTLSYACSVSPGYPVISATREKKARLKGLLIVQLTGGV